MDALNFQVVQTTLNWLEQGNRVCFITVLATWGASPRPIGSVLAYNLDKDIQVGSLSGGCIEDDLFSYLQSVLNNEANQHIYCFTKEYGGSADENARYLLPCGGSVKLLIEPFLDQHSIQHFAELKDALLNRRSIARTLDLRDTSVRSCTLLFDEEIVGQDELIYIESNKQFYHRLDPTYRLLLVGVGDVTLYLSEFAETLGFDVTICEPREVYKKRFKVHELPYKIVYELPDDLLKKNFNDAFSAILCLAHDPKLDDMALMEALVNSKAFYIGAMGSLKTSESRFERLKSLGTSPEQLARLHAPIGLDIQSKTPQEIAVAISAELISARYRHKQLRTKK